MMTTMAAAAASAESTGPKPNFGRNKLGEQQQQNCEKSGIGNVYWIHNGKSLNVFLTVHLTSLAIRGRS